MITLRCTKKLLDRQPSSLLARHAASDTQADAISPTALPTTALGDWYATLLFTRPAHLVLSLSERSRLCVLVPAREPARLLPRWRSAVEEVLLSIGAPAEFVEQELAQMQEVAIGPTRGPDVNTTVSRSVLGSLNDFSSLIKAHLQDHDQAWRLNDLAVYLSGVPCGPLKMDAPREATLNLLAKAHLTREP